MASLPVWEGDDQLVYSNPEQASNHILSTQFILTDPTPFWLCFGRFQLAHPFTGQTLSGDIHFVTCMLVISEGGSECLVRTVFGHMAGCAMDLGSVLR